MLESTNEVNPFESNKLLGVLPAEERERLQPHLKTVALELKEILHEPDAAIEYVYFPIDCVASTLATMEDGRMVEVGTVGNEGMTGLPVFLGTESVPLVSICQIAGNAARMTSDALRSKVRPGDRLHSLLGRFTEATFVFAAQSSACNRLHSIDRKERPAASPGPLPPQPPKILRDPLPLRRRHLFIASKTGLLAPGRLL